MTRTHTHMWQMYIKKHTSLRESTPLELFSDASWRRIAAVMDTLLYPAFI